MFFTLVNRAPLNCKRLDYYFLQGESDREFIKTVHEYVKPCIDCGGECPKGMNMTIFGKEFPNTCFQFPIQFENPDAGTLEHIKELIAYWKVAAPDNTDKLHVLGWGYYPLINK